jgi:hypothetical protein
VKEFLANQRGLALLAAVLLGGALASHSRLERNAELHATARLEQQRLGIERNVRRFDASLRKAESSARSLADQVSQAPADLTPRQNSLDTGLERGPDGSLRSRRDRFQSVRDAGIVLPAGKALTPETRRFLEHAQAITRSVGQDQRRAPVASSWVAPRDRALVLYWPEIPDYLFRTSGLEQYWRAPQLAYSAPSHSPTRAPRWTPPIYDPAARKWLISVVAPFSQNGRWAGAVGHDVVLSELLDHLDGPGSGPSPIEQALYVADREGRLLAARRGGPRGLGERLPERYQPFLEQARAGRGQQVFTSGPDRVIVAPIPSLSAYAIYRLDGEALRGGFPIRVGESAISRNLFLLGLTAGSVLWLWRERTARP